MDGIQTMSKIIKKFCIKCGKLLDKSKVNNYCLRCATEIYKGRLNKPNNQKKQ